MASGKTGQKKSASTFLRDHGVDADRLRVTLGRIDWAHADAFARGQQALVLFIATIAELLLAGARENSRTPGALLNELATHNDPAELPLLGLALQHLESAALQKDAALKKGAALQKSPAPMKGAAQMKDKVPRKGTPQVNSAAQKNSPARHTQALPRLLPAQRNALLAAASTLPAHQRLLREGFLPAARLPELAHIDTDTLLPVLAQQLQASGASRAERTLRLLKFAAQHEDKRSVLLQRVRRVQTLLQEGAQEAVNKNATNSSTANSSATNDGALSYPAFRSLPAALRQTLLFTPVLCRFFLDAQAQAAARPPSPDFDPLYLEHALEQLGRGRLAHVDVDTIFLGAALPAFRARIVDTLANGSGEIRCSDDVRARLLAGANQPELCLLACAAAASAGDVQRALAKLPALPGNGVLGEALYRFALIAWRDALPADVPAALLARADFSAAMLAASTQRLQALLADNATQHDTRSAKRAENPAQAFRQFSHWLAQESQRASKPARGKPAKPIDKLIASSGLAALLALHGSRLAADIDGSDLYVLYHAGEHGRALARVLAATLRQHNRARWEHGFFTRIADLDADVARTLASDNGGTPSAHELDILQQATGTRA